MRDQQETGEVPGAPLLELSSVTVALPASGGVVAAVRQVSLTLQPGETLGVVGESGSGKSVTCLSILRLLPHAAQVSGEIRLAGVDLLSLPEKEMQRIRGRAIGLIHQDPMSALNPVRPIGVQITESLRLHLGLGRRQARDRAVELLARVGISAPRSQLRAYPHQFSGGMRQRIMIAMALACEPRLLLADEPTTALDVSVQAQVLDLLRDLTAEFGIALVLISHDLSVVAGLADRVAVMYAGRIVETAPTDRLFSTPQHPYTAGLLASLAEQSPEPGEDLASIPGHPPDPRNLPAGCAFAPRCPLVHDRCRTQDPFLVEVTAGHQAACWAAGQPAWQSHAGGSTDAAA
jgi:oligopeptide/dipeptide ABC transporter ATP-binding protein